jgi:hypothetical protein
MCVVAHLGRQAFETQGKLGAQGLSHGCLTIILLSLIFVEI